MFSLLSVLKLEGTEDYQIIRLFHLGRLKVEVAVVFTRQESSMIHSANPQSLPAVIFVWFWSFVTDERTEGRTDGRMDNLFENSDHYRPGLWSASWINVCTGNQKERSLDMKYRKVRNLILKRWSATQKIVKKWALNFLVGSSKNSRRFWKLGLVKQRRAKDITLS